MEIFTKNNRINNTILTCYWSEYLVVQYTVCIWVVEVLMLFHIVYNKWPPASYREHTETDVGTNTLREF